MKFIELTLVHNREKQLFSTLNIAIIENRATIGGVLNNNSTVTMTLGTVSDDGETHAIFIDVEESYDTIKSMLAKKDLIL